jgi:hypothetical protein
MCRLFLRILAISLLAGALALTVGMTQAGPRDGGHGGGHAGGGARMGGGGHTGGGGHIGSRQFGGGHVGGMRASRGHAITGRSIGGHRSSGRKYSGRSFRGGAAHYKGARVHHRHVARTRSSRLHARGVHKAGQNAFARRTANVNKVHNLHRGQRKGMHSAKLAHAASIRHHNRFWDHNARGHGWRHHRHFRHGWVGPVFWPYAYGDFFSYALWPYDEYDAFWDYGPDLVVWGAFWPYGDPYHNGYDGYAAVNYDLYGSYRHIRRQRAEGKPADTASPLLASACQGFAPGVTDLPLMRFERIIKPADEQRTALDELRTASDKAGAVMKDSCPAEVPLTPVARLNAMSMRLLAMDNAIRTVRGPLERLYDMLSDEQRARLDKAAGKVRRGGLPPCSGAGVTDVPAGQIAAVLTLDSKQQGELDKLMQVSARAADVMKASCPAAVPSSPASRLDAVERRAGALLQAIDTVRPAVRDFYGSLTDEQKARFNVQSQQGKTAAQ